MKKITGALVILFLLKTSLAFSAVAEDWSAVNSGKDTGTYQDNTGSKIDIATDAGPQGGKALKLTFTLVQGGYCGAWHNITADFSKSGSLKFMAKSTVPGEAQMVLKDAFNIQYNANFQILSKDWVEINIPLSTFQKDTSYIPPNAIQGHPMDLSKTSGMNFAPHMVGTGVMEVGPIETAGTASAVPAAQSVAPEIKVTGPGTPVYDLTRSDLDKAGGTFQDSQGSSIKYTLVDNPAKKGAKYFKVDYVLAQGGYCGFFFEAGPGWDGESWTGGKAISLMIYSKQPLMLGLAIKDKNNNQYTANTPTTKGTGWEKLLIPVDSFKLGQYYTPPDAIKGAPEDLSVVKQLQFQAQTVGKASLAIDSVMLLK